ncbi:bacillithiol system redox-active protein YtxJ [Brevibacillus laterosporus]|uniref:bacillithiol system redox-active protein YtxJ n=1 Tax=Brevibacillus laterosporus TaxID=1465 RepID=UPI000380926A|nr:bacillithiol system redox-active protein YtxJ [Brevibacillus laterosporus]ATO48693.1 general stress protein [Brevibacillus laterosporus DSM 25]AYB41277.1 bacillithiol system redox-active protein YtxJ [Brevibacillus laterosporus]MBG9800884.1 general stress protein [Brevibacillus laterosporus]MBM7108889.1 hypothetical protein [Brevibacillus laterosporus]MED2003677.1 bacillithiol system redox-active protein YtxJ [Brevibacillus laterosporus]
MAFQQLQSQEDLQAFLKKTGKLLLFKHSTVCPISTSAHEQFHAYLQANSDVEAAEVLVREARPVSNEIAEHLQIKHESPQIFLIEDGAVSWHTSHWKITKDAIEQAMK